MDVEEAHEAPSLGDLMVPAFLKVHGVLEPLEMVLGQEKSLHPLIWLHDGTSMMIWQEGHDHEEHGTWTHLETC